MQKNHYKIITVCLLLFCLSYTYAVDIKNLSIGAEINGKDINSEIILKDKDKCVFFLKDEASNKVSLPKTKNISWYLSFPTNMGKTYTKKISEGNLTYTNLSIEPGIISEMFINERADILGAYGCLQEGKLLCYIEEDRLELEIPIQMDLLPVDPELEITNQYVYTDWEFPTVTYPIVTLKLYSDNFDRGRIAVFESTGYKYFMALPDDCDMPYSIEIEGPDFGCSFIFYVYNDYGMNSSNKIYSDIKPSSVEQIVKHENISVKCENGLLCIDCPDIMKNIIIYDCYGKLVSKEKDMTAVVKSLKKGIYIVKIVKKDNNVYKCKILIN